MSKCTEIQRFDLIIKAVGEQGFSGKKNCTNIRFLMNSGTPQEILIMQVQVCMEMSIILLVVIIKMKIV